MSSVLFVFARHGRTAGNQDNIYRSLSNEPFAQLDAAGRDDARELGIFLKGLGYEYPLIITDTLDRTNETAKIVAEILGIKEIVQDKRLLPLKMGKLTGKNKDANPIDEYLKNRTKKIPDGENMVEFDKRQALVFADILELVSTLKKPVLVIGHGSNTSFLYHKVNKGGKEVGYEGLTNPGGASLFTRSGITPVFKSRAKEPKEPLVQLSRWSIEFVGGKGTDGKPKSCFNCHMMYSKQKTCSILGPDIIIDRLNKGEKLYTPVCGEHDPGKPTETDNPTYPSTELGAEKADEVGLEWAEGDGTNCGGYEKGAPCKYFIASEKDKNKELKDGVCLVLKKSDNKVDSDDCCAAHDGPSMEWRNAVELLKKEK
jgi:broad specificity phosphatase PhoE